MLNSRLRKLGSTASQGHIVICVLCEGTVIHIVFHSGVDMSLGSC